MPYKVPPTVPPRPDRPGAPEVTADQGAASSASQPRHLGHLSTKLHASFQLGERLPIRVALIGCLLLRSDRGQTSSAAVQSAVAIRPQATNVSRVALRSGRNSRREAEQDRSHRESLHIHLRGVTRGQLQAPANREPIVLCIDWHGVLDRVLTLGIGSLQRLARRS